MFTNNLISLKTTQFFPLLYALRLYHPRKEESRYLLELRGRSRKDGRYDPGDFFTEEGQEAEMLLVQKEGGSCRMGLGMGC